VPASDAPAPRRVPATLTLDPADPRWAAFVAARPEALPYHHPSWIATLAGCYGFRAFVLAVADPSGRIVAGLPVMEVARRPGGRARWVALPFTDRCPPLAVDDRAERGLAEALRAAADAAGVARVEVRAPLARLAPETVAVEHVLDLAPGAEALARGFSSAARRGVRKARREGVEIRTATTEAELTEVYYGLHLRTRRRLGVPVQPRRFFRLLWRQVLEPGHGRLLLACADGVPIAGAVFLEAGRTVVYKYGASDAAAWSRRPNNLLFAEAIAAAAERGFAAFDFGRSDLADEGLRAFKAGWGAPERPLVYAGADAATAPGTAARAMARVIRRSPPVVCRGLGEALYRYAA
jgi:CelD/BcsL family acetyltransferase involved in cellulose biosynthesis